MIWAIICSDPAVMVDCCLFHPLPGSAFSSGCPRINPSRVAERSGSSGGAFYNGAVGISRGRRLAKHEDADCVRSFRRRTRIQPRRRHHAGRKVWSCKEQVVTGRRPSFDCARNEQPGAEAGTGDPSAPSSGPRTTSGATAAATTRIQRRRFTGVDGVVSVAVLMAIRRSDYFALGPEALPGFIP